MVKLRQQWRTIDLPISPSASVRSSSSTVCTGPEHLCPQCVSLPDQQGQRKGKGSDRTRSDASPLNLLNLEEERQHDDRPDD
jgi:hypothetical protein